MPPRGRDFGAPPDNGLTISTDAPAWGRLRPAPSTDHSFATCGLARGAFQLRCEALRFAPAYPVALFVPRKTRKTGRLAGGRLLTLSSIRWARNLRLRAYRGRLMVPGTLPLSLPRKRALRASEGQLRAILQPPLTPPTRQRQRRSLTKERAQHILHRLPQR
jgi:hypothetical protein